jgi:hypothetical protein
MFIPPQYGQVNLKFVGTPLPYGAQVTWGFATMPSPDIAEVADSIITAIRESTVLDFFTNAMTLASVLVKLGPNDFGPSIEVAASLAGLASSPATTPNTALLVRKNTVAGGHSGSGRMFWPGWVEPNVDGAGQISSGPLAAVQTCFDSLLSKLIAAEVPMMLLHTRENHPLGPLGVTSLRVQGTAATQRRRLRP